MMERQHGKSDVINTELAPPEFLSVGDKSGLVTEQLSYG
jgi:hypothetical protein